MLLKLMQTRYKFVEVHTLISALGQVWCLEVFFFFLFSSFHSFSMWCLSYFMVWFRWLSGGLGFFFYYYYYSNGKRNKGEYWAYLVENIYIGWGLGAIKIEIKFQPLSMSVVIIFTAPKHHPYISILGIWV